MYEIIIQPQAEQFIKQLKKEERKKILDSIGQLAQKPKLGKELVGKLTGLRSLRAGIYRAIYKTEDVKLIILVLRVGYRGNIYAQKFYK